MECVQSFLSLHYADIEAPNKPSQAYRFRQSSTLLPVSCHHNYYHHYNQLTSPHYNSSL